MRNYYRRESIPFLDQREPRWRNCEELEMNSEEQGKNDRTLMRIYCRRCKDLLALMRCGGRRRFSGPVQGDAAAKVEEDKGRGGGGGARALGRQRRKTMEERSE